MTMTISVSYFSFYYVFLFSYLHYLILIIDVEVKDGKKVLPQESMVEKSKGDQQDDDVDDEYEVDFGQAGSWSKVRIYKNLLLMGTSFVFLFTAYQALCNLQSSINCNDGLGLACLSASYAMVIVSGRVFCIKENCNVVQYIESSIQI